MWPWAHAAFGYLLYTAGRRWQRGQPPTGPATLAVGLGTLLPDLVDKPLAWTFGVLETGRSLGHSWLVAAAVLGVLWMALGEERRRLVWPLAVGWLSHGLADGLVSIATWEPAYLAYLIWPVATTPPYETEQSFVAHLMGLEPTPYFIAQIVLVAVGLWAWRSDGYPGLMTLRTAGDAARTRITG